MVANFGATEGNHATEWFQLSVGLIRNHEMLQPAL